MPSQLSFADFRKGISLPELFRMFPDDATAERWFVEERWGGQMACPRCGSINVLRAARHKTMPYRCRDCRRRFSVRVGTVMESSRLGYQTWALAIYILTTSKKGVSSVRLAQDLGITQKSAWHLAHRIRKGWARNPQPFSGPVEVDEAYLGGRERFKHADKKLRAGRGGVGKTAVVGILDRATDRVLMQVVDSTEGHVLKGFIARNTKRLARIYTDEHKGYNGLPNHQSVNHSRGHYVDGDTHTNGIESIWAVLKRGYHGVYHRMSPKHLPRYLDEFSGRLNSRGTDTLGRMAILVRGMEGKRLRYQELVA